MLCIFASQQLYLNLIIRHSGACYYLWFSLVSVFFSVSFYSYALQHKDIFIDLFLKK